MLLELLGGPLDGTICNGPEHLPPYLVASAHVEEPIYQRICCKCCATGKITIPYRFAGYDFKQASEEQIEVPSIPLSSSTEGTVH